MVVEAATHLSESQAVNHEFINSLASVRSLSELLMDYPGLDAGDRTRFLGIIRDETERLVRLMNHRRLLPNNVGSL